MVGRDFLHLAACGRIRGREDEINNERLAERRHGSAAWRRAGPRRRRSSCAVGAMVQSCSAYGCKNRYHKDKDVSFHKFPLARPDLCGKWVAAMKRSNFKPTKYSNICSQHFTKDCFKRECNNRVLKENAVPSLFSSTKLQMKADSLEETFIPEIDFPLTLSNTDREKQEPPDPDLSASIPAHVPVPVPSSSPAPAAAVDDESPDFKPSAFVSCDHNYTVEVTVQQKKRIDQLEEQLEKLRKKLKTVRQKCRRQERQLERFKATRKLRKTGKGLTLGESYVILPKELFSIKRIVREEVSL
ncbi:hypothetical protein AOLI_G00263540 [Acnodon oligacanthus]